jgi:hypothetical protein
VMPVAPVAVRIPRAGELSGYDMRNAIRFNDGRLSVKYKGDFQLSIVNALGRVVKSFKGRDIAGVDFKKMMSGSGVYLVTFKTTDGAFTRKCIAY